jgi:hypothetical protein
MFATKLIASDGAPQRPLPLLQAQVAFTYADPPSSYIPSELLYIQNMASGKGINDTLSAV